MKTLRCLCKPRHRSLKMTILERLFRVGSPMVGKIQNVENPALFSKPTVVRNTFKYLRCTHLCIHTYTHTKSESTEISLILSHWNKICRI